MLPHVLNLEHHLTEQGSPLIAPSPHRIPSPFLPETSLTSYSGSSPATSTTSSPTQPTRSSKLVPLTVRCEVRTRIPSEYGGICHLHLYSNSRDAEEHLAIVYGDDLKSSSLEEVRPGDTERERMLRGARRATDHNGGMTNGTCYEEKPVDRDGAPNGTRKNGNGIHVEMDPPLTRIHSCCFTGETLRSLRCDCAEQLEEAMRLMAREGRGVVLYLKQEGRGIGLRDKLRAYNLIDLGHDTMAANLLLGHPPDARSYEIASAILRDLGIDRVRLLTNNPEKLSHLQNDGVEVAERVPMIPASWRRLGADVGVAVEKVKNGEKMVVDETAVVSAKVRESGGLTLQDRDGYLVTKVQRMGHILDIPSQLLDAFKAASVSEDTQLNGQYA
ncbi:GTP cyclohydrolase II [Spizellomyces sp. 'palustris']|nr:GTP cyclohydrolase II [Spizellomyces sp. 'palustris']